MKNKDNIKKQLWQILLEIPIGETINYSKLSKRLNMAKKTRYISSLLKENPYPISIPCHRVIHKNRKIGKYIWGENFKKFLLDWEKLFK
ncbi:MAG: MGMT family protein [Candidatus Omnitrophica bacterium]|nr:MGMT family protein [Candidatus Omnitrophota bacterium]MCM8808591.1 MGMT family protein [Candidatus Omnitrophota bacterium]MCM8833010.1 MGMT family protein [Candidatus Omnitrophota bacterium]